LRHMRQSQSRIALSSLRRMTLRALTPLRDTRHILNRILRLALTDADFLEDHNGIS